MKNTLRHIATCLSALTIVSCSAPPASLKMAPATEAPQFGVSKATEDSQIILPKMGPPRTYAGPIKMVIDPSLGSENRDKGKRIILSFEKKHHSSDDHAKFDQERFFDPNDPSSLQGIAPTYGDQAVKDEAGEIAFHASTVNLGDENREYRLIPGRFIVRPLGTSEEMLNRLREKYEFEATADDDGEYVLTFNLDKVRLDGLPEYLKELNTDSLSPVEEITFSSVNAAKTVCIYADLMLNYTDVLDWAEWNVLVNSNAWTDQAISTPVRPAPRPPAQGQVYGDWWFTKLGILDAWTWSIGTNAKIAVIDVGFDVTRHPELQRQFVGSAVYDKNGDYVQGGFVDNPSFAEKTLTGMLHGSSVSLFAVGERNNKKGLAGVAPNARLLAYKIVEGRGLAKAIKLAAANGATVINVSSGTPRPDVFFLKNWWYLGKDWNTPIDNAVADSLAKYPRLVIVAAAGNTGDHLDKRLEVLQTRKDVVVVGGIEYDPTTSKMKKWLRARKPDGQYAGSNYGDNVDIWAPAVNLEMSSPSRGPVEFNDAREIVTGTSYSSPIVAGAIALVQSHAPLMNRSEIIQNLRDTATPTDIGDWTTGTRGGVPGTGGYIQRDGRQYLPMLNVKEFVRSVAQQYNWLTLRTRVGMLESGYYLNENGNRIRLLDTVPFGTYQAFVGRTVEVTGWGTINGEFEVLNIKEAPRSISGIVTNSIGSTLSGVTVTVENLSTGQTRSAVTDSSGRYSIGVTSNGTHLIKVNHSSYIPVDFTLLVTSTGPIEYTQNIALSPVLASNQTRIVLSWGASPSDLDSHFTGPKTTGGRFHVYYASQSYSDSKSSVTLDRDDTDGNGPETVTTTITGSISGTYRYFVHDYSNRTSYTSQALSNSQAAVYVYRGNRLLLEAKPPRNTNGTIWEVFEMDGMNTSINPRNILHSPSYVIQSITHQGSEIDLIRNLPQKHN